MNRPSHHLQRCKFSVSSGSCRKSVESVRRRRDHGCTDPVPGTLHTGHSPHPERPDHHLYCSPHARRPCRRPRIRPPYSRPRLRPPRARPHGRLPRDRPRARPPYSRPRLRPPRARPHGRLPRDRPRARPPGSSPLGRRPRDRAPGPRRPHRTRRLHERGARRHQVIHEHDPTTAQQPSTPGHHLQGTREVVHPLPGVQPRLIGHRTPLPQHPDYPGRHPATPQHPGGRERDPPGGVVTTGSDRAAGGGDGDEQHGLFVGGPTPSPTPPHPPPRLTPRLLQPRPYGPCQGRT